VVVVDGVVKSEQAAGEVPLQLRAFSVPGLETFYAETPPNYTTLTKSVASISDDAQQTLSAAAQILPNVGALDC
jgi:hypothetical protein